MTRIAKSFIFIILLFVFLSINNNASAQLCGGGIINGRIYTQTCTPAGCNPVDPSCTCSTQCGIGGKPTDCNSLDATKVCCSNITTYSCDGSIRGQCTDPQGGAPACGGPPASPLPGPSPTPAAGPSPTPMQFYLTCISGSCQSVQGIGTNDCSACPQPTSTPPPSSSSTSSTSSSSSTTGICPAGTHSPHLTCAQSTCTSVGSCGTDQCSPAGSSCSLFPTNPPAATPPPGGACTDTCRASCAAGETRTAQTCSTRGFVCCAPGPTDTPVPKNCNVTGKRVDQNDVLCNGTNCPSNTVNITYIERGAQSSNPSYAFQAIAGSSVTLQSDNVTGYTITYSVAPVNTTTHSNSSYATGVSVNFICPQAGWGYPDNTMDVQWRYTPIGAPTPTPAAAVSAWFQGKGGDMRMDHGFNDTLLSNTTYAMLKGSGGTGGIIFAGQWPMNFGANTGTFSESGNNWYVGDQTNKELFFYPLLRHLTTSYDNYLNIVSKNNLPTSNTSGSFSCGATANCLGVQPKGIYKISGDLIVDQPNQFTTGNHIYLVSGNIIIKSKILVNIGATALFIAHGNITVDPSVGESTFAKLQPPPVSSVCDPVSHTSCDLEGVFSADQQVIFQGASSCPATKDLQLNIAGSLIANTIGAQGKNAIVNNRDLCSGVGGNGTYPSYTISERPDFLVNFPELTKNASVTWQEVAP